MDQEEEYQVFIEVQPQLIGGSSVKQGKEVAEVDDKNKNIYTVLDRGDNIIEKAHRKAIIIVGLSRKGKSTTFNWLLRRILRGFAKQGSVEPPYYINVVENDETSAVVGNAYASVTLAPNVCVDFQPGLSLIDMAGYEDKRNYVGVIGVSYFLKQVFERVKQAKFVIVITESMFNDTSGQELIKTFQGFINMFQYRQMNKEVRTKLRQSIVVVITRSTKEYEHMNKLKTFIQKLMEKSFLVENKNPLLQLFSWLHSKLSRLQPFKAAVSDKPAQPCTFVQKLNNNKEDPWTFFNLEEAEKIMKKSPIAVPFTKDFLLLKQKQVGLFTATIQSRIKSYEGFVTLTFQFIKLFFQNWENFLKPQDDPESKAKDPQFYRKMSGAFQMVSAYVNANNHYQQNILKKFTPKSSNTSITFIQSLRQILKIFAQVQEVTTGSGGLFLEHMQCFKKEFPVFIQCFRSFTTNQEQQKLLHMLQYILKRGFKEFSRLYQLQAYCIVDANAKLRDYFTMSSFYQTLYIKKEYQNKIIKKMSIEVMAKMFKDIAKLDDYEAFFQQYARQFGDLEDPLFMNEHMYNIQSLKASLYLQSSEKKKAISCFIKMYNNLDQTSGIADSSNVLDDEQRNTILNKCSIGKIRMTRKIVQILKVLPQKEDFKSETLQLCLYHKMIEDANEIYELIINTPGISREELKQCYLNYALYCFSWGDVEMAIRLLKKKLKLQEQDFNSYMETVQLMKKFNNQRTNSYRQFSNNLSGITRLPIQDWTIKSMFTQLQFKITTG